MRQAEAARTKIPQQGGNVSTSPERVGQQLPKATCYLCSGKLMAYRCPLADEFRQFIQQKEATKLIFANTPTLE